MKMMTKRHNVEYVSCNDDIKNRLQKPISQKTDEKRQYAFVFTHTGCHRAFRDKVSRGCYLFG